MLSPFEFKDIGRRDFFSIYSSIYPEKYRVNITTYCNYIIYDTETKSGTCFFYIIFSFFNFLTYSHYPYILDTYMVFDFSFILETV